MTSDHYIVYNFKEIYHELGEFEFKIVLSPKFFKNSHSCSLEMVDSDGSPMTLSVVKWGRKINCKFCLGHAVADGVASVRMVLVTNTGETIKKNLTCWIVK